MLDWFKEQDMIRTEKTSRGLVITIVNYELYQDPANYAKQQITEDNPDPGEQNPEDSGSEGHGKIQDISILNEYQGHAKAWDPENASQEETSPESRREHEGNNEGNNEGNMKGTMKGTAEALTHQDSDDIRGTAKVTRRSHEGHMKGTPGPENSRESGDEAVPKKGRREECKNGRREEGERECVNGPALEDKGGTSTPPPREPDRGELLSEVANDRVRELLETALEKIALTRKTGKIAESVALSFLKKSLQFEEWKIGTAISKYLENRQGNPPEITVDIGGSAQDSSRSGQKGFPMQASCLGHRSCMEDTRQAGQ